MIATIDDVGIFLRALVDGTLLTEEEQTTYESLYDYEHGGWVLGYQSIARYHPDTDSVVILFVNSTGGDSEALIHIIYDRVVQIAHRS